MKYLTALILCAVLSSPGLRAEEAAVPVEESVAAPAAEPLPYPVPPEPSLTVGGGVWARYLRLNLRHWTDAAGRRLDRENLLYYGGRLVVSGPLKDDCPLRWRLGAGLGVAGRENDDIDEMNVSLATVALNSGLSWRPGKVGVSLDLSAGGAVIDTEIKRAELSHDWDRYDRRTVGLFFWEPLLSLDFQVLDIFVIRLQGGYSFLYGKGKEVGGPTAGIAFDFGRWM